MGALEATGDLFTEFDLLLLNATADIVTILTNGTMVFWFKDGREVKWQ